MKRLPGSLTSDGLTRTVKLKRERKPVWGYNKARLAHIAYDNQFKQRHQETINRREEHDKRVPTQEAS